MSTVSPKPLMPEEEAALFQYETPTYEGLHLSRADYERIKATISALRTSLAEAERQRDDARALAEMTEARLQSGYTMTRALLKERDEWLVRAEAFRRAFEETDKADVAKGWAAAVARAEKAEAELAEERKAHATELAHVAMSERESDAAHIDELDRELANEIADRERREEWAEDLAASLGCEAEWSNLHDHFHCIRDAALSLLSRYEHAEAEEKAAKEVRARADAAEAQVAKMREAISKVLAITSCRRLVPVLYAILENALSASPDPETKP